MSSPNTQQKKPELLSPAGNMECFFAALENGADAIYFGLPDFSARAAAENFTLEDASKAIAHARKRAVKIYIAFNTLMKTQELEKIVNLLIAVEELQPDALILQDLGLLFLLQSRFPQFSLHASTQMTIHNLTGVKQLERMGFQRVVLARELPMDEITNIARNTAMETEVFVHGALCYSYSGLCFFSSMTGGRSGNRGRCAQPCRMRYKTSSGDGGYLFSMKDLLTISQINKLIAAGVHAFKIEGRMKSPEYVAVVTHAYRQAIDGRLPGLDETMHRIRTVFSRETTHAYVFPEDSRKTKNGTQYQVKSTDTINPSYPANVGSYAGEVIDTRRGKVVIRADNDIGVRDLLQVFDNSQAEPSLLHVKSLEIDGRRVFEIHAGDIAAIGSEQRFMPGAKLYLISSQKVRETLSLKVPKKLIPTRIPVNLEVKIRPHGVSIKGITRHVTLTKDYPVKLEQGIHWAIGEEHIRDAFSRLGATPFELRDIHTDVSEKLFIPFSTLNEIRRDFFQNLSVAYQKEKEGMSHGIKNWIKEVTLEYRNPCKRFSGEDGIRLSLKIDKLQYLNHVPLEKIYKIYVVLSREVLMALGSTKKTDMSPLLSASPKGSDKAVLKKLLPVETATGSTEAYDVINTLLPLQDTIVFSLPVIMRDRGNGLETFGDIKIIVQKLMALGFRQFQLSNLGALDIFETKDVLWYADYPLYCLNPLSAAQLRKLGFCRYTLSPEDDKENLQTLYSADADLIIYQDTPLFISETCVWANMKRRCPGISECGFRQVTVENEHGDRFVAINDRCKTVVIGERPFSIIHRIPKLLEAGQRDFRIDLCWRDYTPEMIEDIFSGIQNRTTMKYATMGNYERGLI
ncbi:MAG: hypothetical protein DCC43_09445 [Candidatus Brocadia sp.]|nr:U32 family peptidase [Candidatus Brocadia sp. AMX3]MDG5997413.1 U32 family peptidase [Candidatus Brocadia sp.]RIJ98664.1 MAG: hypothetical protein DCC43_09445 [Candidatus Brocadia sp.]